MTKTMESETARSIIGCGVSYATIRPGSDNIMDPVDYIKNLGGRGKTLFTASRSPEFRIGSTKKIATIILLMGLIIGAPLQGYCYSNIMANTAAKTASTNNNEAISVQKPGIYSIALRSTIGGVATGLASYVVLHSSYEVKNNIQKIKLKNEFFGSYDPESRAKEIDIREANFVAYELAIQKEITIYYHLHDECWNSVTFVKSLSGIVDHGQFESSTKVLRSEPPDDAPDTIPVYTLKDVEKANKLIPDAPTRVGIIAEIPIIDIAIMVGILVWAIIFVYWMWM
jgi:hypothetical protein